jgi:hypothetical protein
MYLVKELEENNETVQSLIAHVEETEKVLTSTMGVRHPRSRRAAAKISDHFSFEGDYLVPERIAAWAYLFGEELPFDAALMTPHVSIHNYIMEQCQKLVPDSALQISCGAENKPTNVLTMGPLSLPAPKTVNPIQVLKLRDNWAGPIRRDLQSVMASICRLHRGEASSSVQDSLQRLFHKVEEAVESAKKSRSAPLDLSRTLLLTFTMVAGASFEDILEPISTGMAKPPKKDSGTLFILVQIA